MNVGAPAVLRRTWPQRLLMVGNLAVIAACLAVTWTLQRVESTLVDIPTINFAQSGVPLLAERPEPGEPVNFLLVGSDSAARTDPSNPVNDGRGAINETANNGRSQADAMMLLRLDPSTGRASVVSIPRDLWVPIAGAQDQKINAALFLGGAPKLVETVTEYFDVPVHHYMQVDFAGFGAVVDAIGGVPVYFENPARDQKALLSIPDAGCITLDGFQALAYVRGRNYQEFIDGSWRRPGDLRDDFARTSRQRDFLILALERAVERTGRNPLEIDRLVQAVTGDGDSIQLDDELKISDLVAIGNAFVDFDPEALQRYALPVRDRKVVVPKEPEKKNNKNKNNKNNENNENNENNDSDSGESGEAGDTGSDSSGDSDGEADEVEVVEETKINGLLLLESEAQPILDVFRGAAGFVRPADVTVRVSQGSASPDKVADAVDNLRSRGFDVVNSGEVSPDAPTSVVFHGTAADHAELVTRFLEKLPAAGLTSGEVGPIDLIVGSDYLGVRFLPRPEAEVRTILASAKEVSSERAPSSTIGEDDGSSTPQSTLPANPPADSQDAPSESSEEAASSQTSSTTTVVVQGKVPAGSACS